VRRLFASAAAAVAAHAERIAAEARAVSERTYLRGYSDGFHDGVEDQRVVRRRRPDTTDLR
jgi:flagellar biosynthesis/type III secretory pathway protein FliH